MTWYLVFSIWPSPVLKWNWVREGAASSKRAGRSSETMNSNENQFKTSSSTIKHYLSRNIQNKNITKKNVILRRFWHKIQIFQISDLSFLTHKYLIPQKTNAWFHWKPLSPKKHIVSSVQIFLEGSYQGHFLLVQGKLSARAISANLKLSLYKVFVNLILCLKVESRWKVINNFILIVYSNSATANENMKNMLENWFGMLSKIYIDLGMKIRYFISE